MERLAEQGKYMDAKLAKLERENDYELKLAMEEKNSKLVEYLEAKYLEAKQAVVKHLAEIDDLAEQRKLRSYLMDGQQQKLQQESLFIAISVLCFIIMLILLLRQRNQISLTLTGQLICFLPEECIGELEALHQQLKSEHYSPTLVPIIMLQNILLLFFQFYVQINIENLWLLLRKGRK